MHSLKLNVRVVGLVAVLATVAFLLFSAPRSASAVGPFDLTSVLCMDLYLDADPAQTKGDPPGTEDVRVAKILWRVEPSATQPTDGWDMTAVAYQGPDENDDLLPDKPPSADDCKVKEDSNSLNPSVDFQDVDLANRPSAVAKLVDKGTEQNLEWTICQFQESLGQWVETSFNVVIPDPQKDLSAGTQNFGTQTATFYPDTDCTGTAGDSFNLVIHTFARTVTTGFAEPGVADDWDGDGCTDWNELDPVDPLGADPFNQHDCNVGGIAELAELDGTALETGGSSGPSAGVIAGLAGGVTVAAIALVGAAWYARRRLVRVR